MGIAAHVPSGHPNFDSVRWKLYLGGMGIRTPDLLIANETLYQLSYTPNKKTLILTTPHFNPPETQELQLMFVL